MMNMEENQEAVRELERDRGKKQADITYLVNMALKNIKSWSDIWREVRMRDVDCNGVISKVELTDLINDYFSEALEGMSLN